MQGPSRRGNDTRGIGRVPNLVERLYEIVSELETSFEGRRFTLDGHLVGSLGEVLAAHRYVLELLPASTERHDARSESGRLIQIEATQGQRVQGRRVGLRNGPDHLIVLLIKPDGSAKEVFNGPGSLAWDNVGDMQRNGQCSIALSKLQALMTQVSEEERLPTVNGQGAG